MTVRLAADGPARAQVAALETVVSHVRSETTNDLDQIMATVSEHPCYLMPDVTQRELPISVLTDVGEVRAYYAAEREVLEIVDAADLAELSTDWYVFHEGICTTREVRSGELFRHTYVVLFPVAPDGIVGEILWPRQSLASLYAGEPGPSVTTDVLGRRVQIQQVYEQYLAALRAGDADAAAACWAPDARVAVRHGSSPDGRPLVCTGRGPEAVAERIALLLGECDGHSAALQARVLHRVVGEWYIFVEWLAGGAAPGTPQRRIASIHPVDADGRLAAELGYALDPAAR